MTIKECLDSLNRPSTEEILQLLAKHRQEIPKKRGFSVYAKESLRLPMIQLNLINIKDGEIGTI